MSKILEKGTDFVMRHARLLERAVFENQLFNISPTHIITILTAYQNSDGGFGHALEPDLRCPDSQPLYVEFALRTLYDCKLRDETLTLRACDFLSVHADLEHGIPTIFSSSRCFPRAPHWENPASEQRAMDRLTSIVGLANWQKVNNEWLHKGVEACIDNIATAKNEDAHTIHNAFCLLESVSEDRDIDHLYNKLKRELFKSNFFILETPVEGYGLTPLNFAPSPESFCRPLFTEQQINQHLTDMETRQLEDGGWEIEWNPPGETAYWEWRGYRTVQALSILKAYGRI